MFDVSGIDVDSLLLKRADGLGDNVAPITTARGRAAQRLKSRQVEAQLAFRSLTSLVLRSVAAW